MLEAKEGLALINGTDGMLGMLLLACEDLARLCTVADVVAAMSVEALLGTDQVFLPELQALRPHPGQAASAANMLRVLAGSEIVASHRDGDTRVQDAYSLRCAPQVTGAVRDTLAHAQVVAERELASAIDNPVVLDDGTGQFERELPWCPPRVRARLPRHRVPPTSARSPSAGPTGYLTRLALMVCRPSSPQIPGVDSGLMIAHYTQASLVSQSKRLAVPASVDSMPTSAMQEDHVSMGWDAGRKLRLALRHLSSVLAVELVAAARAIELRAPLCPSPATAAAVASLREVVPGTGPDRFLSPELAVATEFVRSGRLVEAVEQSTGTLQ